MSEADQVAVTRSGDAALVALGARVHLFVHPTFRMEFLALFRDVLRQNVHEGDFGMDDPVAIVAFDDGSVFSVEWTELAPMPADDAPIDDERAPRGAWIEFRTADFDACHAALRSAGIPEFRHPGSSHTYFVAPGGQVFRVLDVGYVGP